MERSEQQFAVFVTTMPVSSMVTLDEAKAHLHVDTTADDARIQALIDGAEGYLGGTGGIMGRTFAQTTYTLTAPGFPTTQGPLSPYINDRINFPKAIRLPFPPSIDIDVVGYTDPDGAAQVIDAANYVMFVDGFRGGLLAPVEGFQWPETQRDNFNAIGIEYTAGYSLGSFPPQLRSAVLLLVQSWYDEPGRSDIPEVVRSLVAPLSTGWV